MIPNELAAKFHLPPLEEYGRPERDWLHSFLAQSDYVVTKIAELSFLGEKPEEDFSDVLNARKYARKRINELEETSNG